MAAARFGHLQQRKNSGFTLLEVMLVLLMMGLAAGYVIFNAFGASQSDQLKEQARRLQVVVDMASDFAVLNQQQMGLRIEERENRYFFMYLDDEDKWQKLDAEKLYQTHTLPEAFSMTLTLSDLPWVEQEQLFDREIFDESLSVADEEVNIGNEEDAPPPPPQILILSSGEVTPFSLTFSYEPGFGSDDPAYFILNNKDLPPLELLGPLEQLE